MVNIMVVVMMVMLFDNYFYNWRERIIIPFIIVSFTISWSCLIVLLVFFIITWFFFIWFFSFITLWWSFSLWRCVSFSRFFCIFLPSISFFLCRCFSFIRLVGYILTVTFFCYIRRFFI